MAEIKKLSNHEKKLKEADIAREVRKLTKRESKSSIDARTREHRGLDPLPKKDKEK